MVLCAAFSGIGCGLVLMVCVVDGQRQLEAERIGCLRMCLRCGLVQIISTYTWHVDCRDAYCSNCDDVTIPDAGPRNNASIQLVRC